MEIKNRKASYDYFIDKEIEAGIVLTGTEIKSLRKGSANIKDSYAKIKNDEAYLLNMFIAKYDEGNRFNHEERRTRKLLLHKKEILKLSQKVKEKQYTVVPTKIYFKDGLAKVEIALAKGKKLYDKRETEKEKDTKRAIDKAMKNNY